MKVVIYYFKNAGDTYVELSKEEIECLNISDKSIVRIYYEENALWIQLVDDFEREIR